MLCFLDLLYLLWLLYSICKLVFVCMLKYCDICFWSLSQCLMKRFSLLSLCLLKQEILSLSAALGPAELVMTWAGICRNLEELLNSWSTQPVSLNLEFQIGSVEVGLNLILHWTYVESRLRMQEFITVWGITVIQCSHSETASYKNLPQSDTMRIFSDKVPCIIKQQLKQ